ncbi:MAG: hypothetical protein J2P16_07065, partial [Mycobacterium sp.]|nr:hypothetical protein [Mycobacterium sp.]
MSTGPPGRDAAAEDRALQAKIAALTRWANTPPAERSRINKAAFRRRWENKVDPDRLLTPAERAVLVES